MNPKDLIASLLQSKHTSAAGLILLLCGLGEIWLPDYKKQFSQTEKFVMGYGFLMAGDAIKKGVKNGQTETITRAQAGLPPNPPP